MSHSLDHIAGIDFGARMAGTTAITYVKNNLLIIEQCTRKSDADSWLAEKVELSAWNILCLDAPLSLPAGCLGKGHDFTFRKADRLTRAMSPMFLGGLTARAMSHAHAWRTSGKKVLEAYPGFLVQQFPVLKPHYQKKQIASVPTFVAELQKQLPIEIACDVTTYHQADSLLCWYTGYRYVNGLASSFGEETEGLIWI